MLNQDVAHGAEPPRIAVVGSINHDSTIRVARLPLPGETVAGYERTESLGGKGANQAVAAALAGAAVELVGAVGDDPVGADAVAQLRRYGVGTSRVARLRNTATGVAHIHVAVDGENSIVLAPGANMASRELLLPSVGTLSWAQVVLLQLEVPLPLVVQAARRAREFGRRVVLTPAPARRLPAELIECVDVLVPNEVEVTAITGESDVDAACRALAARGVDVLNTRGSAGCAWFGKDGERFDVPAVPVKAFDTTGAGDCFTGNFAAHWARTGDVHEAVSWASSAAALSVQSLGAAPSMPTQDEVAFATGTDPATYWKDNHAKSR